MDFITWSGEFINRMADQFAKCDDPDDIRDILYVYHRLWIAELDYRLRTDQQTGQIIRKLDSLEPVTPV
jgi:hypothetical protein